LAGNESNAGIERYPSSYNPCALGTGEAQVTAYGFLAVGIGAVLGAWLRWVLGIAFNPTLPTLPLGTLAANLVGGYVIGISVEYLSRHTGLPPEVRLFMITGFLGGLTTFSTFSAEATALLQAGQIGWAALHTIAHLVGSIALTFLGIYTVRVFST
jgi:fluoride exporter